jgi:N-acetyl-anhydromuramyl-L-alanine amidase AmpD
MMALFRSALITGHIEARNWSRQLGPQRKKWIVLHDMQMAEKDDTATGCAGFFRDQQPGPSGSSCNFCASNREIIECVPAELVAWHAPGANQYGIGIEHAGFAKQTRAQWLDDYGKQMLSLSAKLCAELCQHFGIPAVELDPEDLRAGLTGITTHAAVTIAFPEKSHGHIDPGPEFPLDYYLERVRGHLLGTSAEV